MKKILFAALSLAIISVSCRYVAGERIRGNGNVQTENRSEGGFKGVESYGSFDLFVSTAPSHSIRIEAEENILPYIETYVDGDILKIDTKDGYWLKPRRSIKVYVSAPEYRRIKSHGSGDIVGENKIIGADKLELGVTGSADIKMEVDAPEVTASITGSGNVNLSGKTKTFSTSVSGSGDVHAYDLLSEDTKVRVTGSGDADVFASVSLDVSVAGSGDVRYKGNAKVSSNISGSGGVKKVD
jgi:hypothetical protein